MRIFMIAIVLVLALPSAFAAEDTTHRIGQKLLDYGSLDGCSGVDCQMKRLRNDESKDSDKPSFERSAKPGSIADMENCSGPACEMKKRKRDSDLKLRKQNPQDPAGYMSGGDPEPESLQAEQDCANGNCRAKELLGSNPQADNSQESEDEEGEDQEEKCDGPSCEMKKEKRDSDFMGKIGHFNNKTEDGNSPYVEEGMTVGKVSGNSEECNGPSCEANERKRDDQTRGTIGRHYDPTHEDNSPTVEVSTPQRSQSSQFRIERPQRDVQKKKRDETFFGRTGRWGDKTDD